MTHLAFDGWARELQRLDDCPWPGPRPLDSTETLVGRAADREEFGLEVGGSSLVVLSGASGVGKSSFLRAGLIPDLERDGYVVALCDDYSGDLNLDKASGSAVFMARKVANSFAAAPFFAGNDVPEDQTLFPFLNSKLADRAVLVFDQFEELIRHAPTQKMAIFEFIIELHRTFNTKIIISLRDEYLHELRWIEHRAKGFSYSKFILEDLEHRHAVDVVSAVNDGHRHGAASRTIESDAAEKIAAEWVRATSETSLQSIHDPFGRIGLLHLQAFLYCLDARSEPGPIGLEPVEAVLDDLGSDQGQASDIFKEALVEAVDVKLQRCREASYNVGIDGFLVEGTAGLLARSVTHLSSAGYKLVREATDLFEATMGPDLEVLLAGTEREGIERLSGEAVGGLIHALTSTIVIEDDSIDLVGSTRAELLERLHIARELWAGRLDRGSAPWDADPLDVTCGVLSGLTAETVVIEEARRFVFAVAWLAESSLVRLAAPTESTTMVSLIHDGFGRALHEWAANRIRNKDVALHALTAAPAPSLVWVNESHGTVGGRKTPSTIANLRWKGGFAVADFRNVIFVNCDFRGTLFNRCTFAGVTMINCLLDGTIISDCSFVGDPAPIVDQQKSDGAPTFLVSAETSYVEQFIAYREQPAVRNDVLYSPLPGAPAVPAGAEDRPTLSYQHEGGGLCFYGGRLSALVVRGCDFSAGSLALRYAAGSGLEVVEMASANVEITGSAIRHVAFTAPAVNDGPSPLDVRVDDTLLGQVWFGQETEGRFAVSNSRILQAWNEGVVEVDGSNDALFVDARRAVLDDTSRSESSVSSTLGDPGEQLQTILRSIDYRRNPARERSRLDARSER